MLYLTSTLYLYTWIHLDIVLYGVTWGVVKLLLTRSLETVCWLTARRRKEPSGEANRKQDGVCAAWLCAITRSRLRRHSTTCDRRLLPQSVHVQLDSQIDEYRGARWRRQRRHRRLSAVHQRGVGDRSAQVWLLLYRVLYLVRHWALSLLKASARAGRAIDHPPTANNIVGPQSTCGAHSIGRRYTKNHPCLYFWFFFKLY